MLSFTRHSAVTTSAISAKIDTNAKTAPNGTSPMAPGSANISGWAGGHDERVRHHQADGDLRDLAVKVIDDVLAPRGGDVTEARGEPELQAHHRQAGIADRDRKLRPEIARGRQRPQKKREQRGEDEEQVNDDPNRPAHGTALHRSPPPAVAAPAEPSGALNGAEILSFPAPYSNSRPQSNCVFKLSANCRAIHYPCARIANPNSSESTSSESPATDHCRNPRSMRSRPPPMASIARRAGLATASKPAGSSGR